MYYVYILASDSGTLYVGMTNDLRRRVFEHKESLVEGFSKKYACKKLVYFEEGTDVDGVILREKQIKKWRREKKVFLIEGLNPAWRDLFLDIL